MMGEIGTAVYAVPDNGKAWWRGIVAREAAIDARKTAIFAAMPAILAECGLEGRVDATKLVFFGNGCKLARLCGVVRGTGDPAVGRNITLEDMPRKGSRLDKAIKLVEAGTPVPESPIDLRRHMVVCGLKARSPVVHWLQPDLWLLWPYPAAEMDAPDDLPEGVADRHRMTYKDYCDAVKRANGEAGA